MAEQKKTRRDEKLAAKTFVAEITYQKLREIHSQGANVFQNKSRVSDLSWDH